MMLRTSLLVNGMLYSLEAICYLSKNHINLLEECDKLFMRRLFEVEQGTPIESYYLETSTWPLRFILMGRKLMFYWTILNKSESELVKTVFNAQKDFPTHNDWISNIQGVLKNCNITCTEQEIANMSKMKFKKIVKEQIQHKVMAYLIGLQNSHKKSQSLHLEAKMQEYLVSSEISLRDKKLLFKLRSKMLNVKSNFKNLHTNLHCSLCLDKESEENEVHLLSCPFIKNKIGNELEDVNFGDIFLGINKQVKAVKAFRKVMEIYKKHKN